MTQTTDTTKPTKAVPQRAVAKAAAPTQETQAATGLNIPETDIYDTDQTDHAIVTDDHIAEADPYAEVEGKPDAFVREPFGEPRLKLQAPARAGYRRYWFNDDQPGRIQRAIAAGYSFVKANGRNTRNVVGRAKNGGAQIAYLMEIPEEWFVQDMRRQQARVDEIDAAIKGGTINKEGGTATKDGDNRYVPKEGISYEPQRASS